MQTSKEFKNNHNPGMWLDKNKNLIPIKELSDEQIEEYSNFVKKRVESLSNTMLILKSKYDELLEEKTSRKKNKRQKIYSTNVL